MLADGLSLSTVVDSSRFWPAATYKIGTGQDRYMADNDYRVKYHGKTGGWTAY